MTKPNTRHRGVYRQLPNSFFEDVWSALPAAPPTMRELMTWLCVGPVQRSVPGLLRIGDGELADRLGCKVAHVRKLMAQLSAAGRLKQNSAARLVWLPWRFEHEVPANPKVVLGWRSTLEQLPECDLTDEIIAYLRQRLGTRGRQFVEAFDRVADRHGPETVPDTVAATVAVTVPDTVSAMVSGTVRDTSEEAVEAEIQRNNQRRRSRAPQTDEHPPPLLQELDCRSPGCAAGWPKDLIEQLVQRVSASVDTWEEFFVGAKKFAARRRDAALREFLRRRCPEDGKGPMYLLGMIREGAGNPQPEQEPFDQRPAWERDGYATAEEYDAAAQARTDEVLRA